MIHRLRPILLREVHKGSSLITSMILMTLIALSVMASFFVSSSNLMVVSNVQRASEARAAGLQALEQAVASQMKTLPALNLNETKVWAQPGEILVDIDGNSKSDFKVVVTRQSCIEAVLLTQGYQSGSGTSLTLGDGYTPFVAYDALWVFQAVVSDELNLGASTQVEVGARIQMTQPQIDAYCPIV